MAIAVLPFSMLARPTYHPELGIPEGHSFRLWFSFLGGTGTTVENYANHHACTSPAYSQANWAEVDGALEGDTGTPSWNTASDTVHPGLTFTRANNHRIRVKDTLASCTTGEHHIDALSAGDWVHIAAYVRPTAILTCADLGNKYMIASKWDASGTDCSYRVYLKAVDTNGGGCVDTDMRYRVVAEAVDDNGTFSCASPCTREAGSFGDLAAGTASTVEMTVQYGLGVSVYLDELGNSAGCDSGTWGVNDVANNSAADLLIGSGDGGSTEAFEGEIRQVLLTVPDAANDPTSITDFNLNSSTFAKNEHFDTDHGSGLIGGINKPPFIYGMLKNGASVVSGGRHKNAVELDGTNDYVLYPKYNLPDFSLDMFISVWIYPHDADGGGTNEQTIAGLWTYDDDVSCTVTDYGMRLYLTTTGKVAFDYKTPSGTTTLTGTTTLSDNTWYHVSINDPQLPTKIRTDFTAGHKHLLLNDSVEDSAAITSYGFSKTKYLIGASEVDSPGTTCASGEQKDFFDGLIDEFYSHNSSKESMGNSIVINEVNFNLTEEEIELYVFDGITGSIDMKDYQIKNVSNFSARSIIFDDACGDCASKVVDPGDYVIVRLNGGGPGVTDTSCSGVATSCVWNAKNSSASQDLSSGNLGTTDGVFLFHRDGHHGPIDAVYWESFPDLEQIGVTGVWALGSAVATDNTTTTSDSICLANDGVNARGVYDWTQCSDTIGASNAGGTTHIDLGDLQAQSYQGATTVLWNTLSEVDTFGFKILRSDTKDGPFVEVSQLVESRGGIGHGFSYEFIDADTSGHLYYYMLQEVTVRGATHEHGPIRAQLYKPGVTEKVLGGFASDNSAQDQSLAVGETADYQASGCGAIVNDSSRTPLLLLTFIVLLMLVSLRTHVVFKK